MLRDSSELFVSTGDEVVNSHSYEEYLEDDEDPIADADAINQKAYTADDKKLVLELTLS